MGNKRPDVLYRGIVVNVKDLFDMKLEGELMYPFHKPLIDKYGRKTDADGNEYGIYMTTNLNMAEDAYGKPRMIRGIKDNKNVTIDTPPIGVCLPQVGIIYEINTNELDIREPWLCEVFSKGHYNNGYSGVEWIADKIPADNYKIIKIAIGNDILHDSEIIDIKTSFNDEKEDILDILSARKKKLKELESILVNVSPTRRANMTMYSSSISALRSLLKIGGLVDIGSNNIDTKMPKGLLDYALSKLYEKDGPKININKIEYIQGLKNEKFSSNSELISYLENENKSNSKKIEDYFLKHGKNSAYLDLQQEIIEYCISLFNKKNIGR